MLNALLPLLYLVITTPLQLYIVQFIIGACTAITFPPFMAMYTRHIDKRKEGTEWGVYFTLTGLVSAAFAAIGGYVAASDGFPILIISVVIISVFGAFLLLPIKPFIRLK